MVRVIKIALCLGIAGVIIWRGNSCDEGAQSTMIVPVMCAATAICLMLIALGIGLRSGEADHER